MKLNCYGFDAEIKHIGGNYNYGIYDVTISRDGEIIYQNPQYRYRYVSFGAIYQEVVLFILRDNGYLA